MHGANVAFFLVEIDGRIFPLSHKGCVSLRDFREWCFSSSVIFCGSASDLQDFWSQLLATPTIDLAKLVAPPIA